VTPGDSRRAASEGGRTRARTCVPRVSSASTTWPPSAPVPPTTSTGPLSVMAVSSCPGRDRWLVNGALPADRAVGGERRAVEVEAPRDGRRDPQVGGGPELA